MEPRRDQPPENNFLHRVRKIADKIGAVLIFDEVSAGFRMNIGGIHLSLVENQRHRRRAFQFHYC